MDTTPTTTGVTTPSPTQASTWPQGAEVRQQSFPAGISSGFATTETEQEEGSLWLPVFLGFTVLTAWMIFTFFAGRWYQQAKDHIGESNEMIRPIVLPTVVPTTDVYGK